MLWDESTLDAELLLREMGPESVKHSAKYLRDRNPKLYQSITLCLSYGIPVSVIAFKTGVGENTIRAVMFQEQSSLEDSKEAIKSNLRKFVHGASMVLLENLHKLDLDKLPAAINLLNNQLLLLDGQATQITRHEHTASIDDVAEQIAAAQRQARGRVVDEPAETGLVLTNKSPVDAPAPAPVTLADSSPAPDMLGGTSGGQPLVLAGNPPMECPEPAVLSGALYYGDPDAPSADTGERAGNGGGGGSEPGGGEEGR